MKITRVWCGPQLRTSWDPCSPQTLEGTVLSRQECFFLPPCSENSMLSFAKCSPNPEWDHRCLPAMWRHAHPPFSRPGGRGEKKDVILFGDGFYNFLFPLINKASCVSRPLEQGSPSSEGFSCPNLKLGSVSFPHGRWNATSVHFLILRKRPF